MKYVVVLCIQKDDIMIYYYKTKCYKIKYMKFGGENMEIGYEESFDDLAIILVDDYEYDRSVEVDAGFIVDVDKNNKLCSIEILDCSKRINKSKDYVKNAKIDVFVEVYDFSYQIIISFNDGEEEIKQRLLK